MESVYSAMKIRLIFNEKKFEYDIFNLIRAFYPEAEMEIRYEETDQFMSEETEPSSGKEDLPDLVWQINPVRSQLKRSVQRIRKPAESPIRKSRIR